MLISVVWVVLAGVVLTDNRIRGQVQKQAAVLSDDPLRHFIKVIFRDDLFQDKVGTNLKIVTALRRRQKALKIRFLRKVTEIILVRKHHPLLPRNSLADGCVFGNSVLLFFVVDPVIRIVDVGKSLNLFDRNSILVAGDFYFLIEIHGLHLRVLINTRNDTTKRPHRQ